MPFFLCFGNYDVMMDGWMDDDGCVGLLAQKTNERNPSHMRCNATAGRRKTSRSERTLAGLTKAQNNNVIYESVSQSVSQSLTTRE